MCRARGGRGRSLVLWWLGRDLWDCQYVVNDAVLTGGIIEYSSKFTPSLSLRRRTGSDVVCTPSSPRLWALRP